MTITIAPPPGRYGTSGNDHLYVNEQDTAIFGMDGDDIIESSLNANFICGDAPAGFAGGSGNDTVSYVASNAAVQVDLTASVQHGGYAEADQLFSIENVIGSAYNDTISGDSGSNRLEGGAGADILDGRGGTDTAIYSSAPSSMTITLGEGTSDGTANVDAVAMHV